MIGWIVAGVLTVLLVAAIVVIYILETFMPKWLDDLG